MCCSDNNRKSFKNSCIKVRNVNAKIELLLCVIYFDVVAFIQFNCLFLPGGKADNVNVDKFRGDGMNFKCKVSQADYTVK